MHSVLEESLKGTFGSLKAEGTSSNIHGKINEDVEDVLEDVEEEEPMVPDEPVGEKDDEVAEKKNQQYTGNDRRINTFASLLGFSSVDRRTQYVQTDAQIMKDVEDVLKE